jgi:hypothetical protein
MRTQLRRVGAVLGLLLIVFNNLARRTWWAYRLGQPPQSTPRITTMAQRPSEPRTGMRPVDTTWRPLVEQALPVQAVAAYNNMAQTDLLPVVWIDATDRPDVADLPRILASGTHAGHDPAVVASDWFRDIEAERTVLIITFVEPVVCTCSISFDQSKWTAIRDLIAETENLFVALEPPPPTLEHVESGLPAVFDSSLPYGFLLSIPRTEVLG